MTTQVCKNCRYWTKDPERPPAGTCNSPKFIYDDSARVPADCLVYRDYEGFDAEFFTGPEFGCIHWSPLP